MSRPTSSSSSSSSTTSTTSGTTHPTGAAPLAAGRWKFSAPAGFATVGHEATLDSEEVPCNVREMYRLDTDAPAGDMVPVMVQRRQPNSDMFRFWITRARFDALVAAGEPVPQLMPAHLDSGGYLPITRPAFSLDKGPQIHDAWQGSIGTCRAASAFQAIAAQPKGRRYLRQLIEPLGATEWLVHLRHVKHTSGVMPTVRTPIAVDNCLPLLRRTATETGQPARVVEAVAYQLEGITQATTTAVLWAALIEKALAVLWGGYEWVQDTNRYPLKDDAIMGALGFGTGRKFEVGKVPPENPTPTLLSNLKAAVLGAWERGEVITAAGFAPRHNYAVIHVDDEGAVLCDPRTKWDPAALQRKSAPTLRTRSYGFFTNQAYWPIKLGWSDLAKSFMWFTAYDLAPTGTTDQKDNKYDKDGNPNES